MTKTNKTTKIWRSCEEASKWAVSEKITTQKQWFGRCKTVLPKDIPSNPQLVYKDQFQSWGCFLKTGRIATKQRKYLKYHEVSKWAQDEGITTRKEWRQRCKKGLPDNIPANPSRFYANEFKGWGDFLGTNRVANQKRLFCAYNEASMWAQEQGVKSCSQWTKRCQSEIPIYIPKYPNEVYKEFTTWGKFLGTGRLSNKNTVFLSYKEAKALALQEKVATSKEWRNLCQTGVLKNVPTMPERYYSEFISWANFLGTKNIATSNRKYCTQDECREWAKQEGVSSSKEWFERCKQEKPEEIPACPQSVYGNDFRGWIEFLGVKVFSGMSKVERVLRYVLENVFEPNMVNDTQSKIVVSNGKRHRIDICLPSINLIVEYDGWRWHKDKSQHDINKTNNLCFNTSWKVIRVRGAPLELLFKDWDVNVDENSPYKKQVGDVLKHIVRLGDKGMLNIPHYSFDKIKYWLEKGFQDVNFRDILDKYDGFKSYQFVSSWAQQEKIISQKQWYKRCLMGLPEGIPSSPQTVYSEFKSWGEFLGTNRIANKNKVFVSYEEASQWAQQQKIKSRPEWRLKCKEGLPKGIPSHPDSLYKGQFRSWGEFLNTGFVAYSIKSYLPYQNVCDWVKMEGITSSSQWRKRCKQGLPPGIPSNVNLVYKDDFKKNDGWYGFFGKKRPKNV